MSMSSSNNENVNRADSGAERSTPGICVSLEGKATPKRYNPFDDGKNPILASMLNEKAVR